MGHDIARVLQSTPELSSASSSRTAETETNLAQLFRARSATYAERLRWREQRHGIWQQATFRENQRIVNALIGGLYALGARPGDVIGILSGTRWEWTAADWAILGLGCVTTAIYAASTPATIAYILNDSGARYLFVENRLQYEKLLQIKPSLGALRAQILFDDAEQLTGDPVVVGFDALQQLGGWSEGEADTRAASYAAAIHPEDLSSIIYTSGTTGEPKGVMLSHRALAAQLAGVRAMFWPVQPGWRDLLWLPLSHVLGRLEHFFAVDRGAETTVLTSIDRLASAMRETRPNIFLSVPRIYEKAHAAILEHVAQGAQPQRALFEWALSVGRKASQARQNGRPMPVWLRVSAALADRIALTKVRAGFGGDLHFAVSGAAPLEPAILEFFHAAGVLLLEGWGLTETGGAFTVNTTDRYRLGTVGHAFPGHQIRVAADGEILVRGPCLFQGYYRRPEATAEAIDGDGWFHTGDIGSLDTDGFLRILDRKKDLIATAGGKKIAPQMVEGLLKSIPLVSQACVYGDRKKYLVALLTLDAGAVAAWATQHGITNGGTGDHVLRSSVLRAYLDQQVSAVNVRLASYEQIKYYDVLAGDFTVENDMLTPTLKIRRKVIYERYRDRFEALYQEIP